jgi:O-antigen ligase
MELEGVAIALVSASVVSLGTLAVLTVTLPQVLTKTAEARAAPLGDVIKVSLPNKLGHGGVSMRRRFEDVAFPSATVSVAVIIAIAGGMGLAIATLSVEQAIVVLGLVCSMLAAGFIVFIAGVRGFTTISLYCSAVFLPLNALRIAPSVAVSDLFLMIAGISIVFGISHRFHQKIRHYRQLLMGTTFIFLGGYLGSIAAGDAVGSLEQLARLVIASSLLPIIVAIWAPDIRQLRVIAWLWVLAASTNALAAFLGVNTNLYNQRPRGFSLHPNHLALSAVLAVGPAIMLAVSSQRLGRILALGCSVSLAAGIVMSGSRAGALGLAAALVALGALAGRMKVAGLLVCGLFLTAVAIRTGLISTPPTSALGRLSSSGATSAAASNVGRWEAIQTSLAQIAAHPFTGVGFQDALAAHNIYLQLLSSAGVLGLVGIALVVLGVMRTPIIMIKVHIVASTSAEGAIMVGFAASYVGFLVAAFFQNALWERFMWLPPALIVASASQVWSRANDKSELRQEAITPRSSLPSSPRGRLTVHAIMACGSREA